MKTLVYWSLVLLLVAAWMAVTQVEEINKKITDDLFAVLSSYMCPSIT